MTTGATPASQAAARAPHPVPDPARVRCLGFDSDGTLTDRGIGWDSAGQGFRRFDVRDGVAMQWAVRLGLPVVVISGKSSPAVDARLAELGVPGFQDVRDKVACLERFLAERGLALADCAFLGDDLPDLPVLRAVGYPMAVADASPLVRRVSVWQSAAPGGFGAAREAIEHVLKARGLWERVLERYGARDLAPDPHQAPTGAGRVFE